MNEHRQAFLDAAGAFLVNMHAEQGGGRDLAKLGATDDLWDLGVLDSLNIIRFLLFVEDWIGRDINIEDGAIDSFRSLDRVYAAHVLPEPAQC